jgi:putative tricarboxylic transport membrane protein
VLGPMVERSLRQSLTISHGDLAIFITRPISAVLIGIALVSLCVPVLRGILDWRKKMAGSS